MPPAILVFVIATILATGCASRSSSLPTGPADTQQQSAEDNGEGLSGLPNPADIARTPATLPEQFTGLCRYREAFDYRRDLPNKCVYGWIYQEVLPITASPYTGLTYAIYEFNLAEMPDDWVVHLDWAIAPGPGDIWVGLANFTGNRWDWFSADDPAIIPEPHSDYLGESGETYVIVVAPGTTSVLLEGLWFGENQPPVAHLDADWSCVVESTEVTLDASRSFDPEGAELTYYWDIENDGEIDFTTEEPELPITYPVSGGFATVWLSDGTGAYVRDSNNIIVSYAPESDWLDMKIMPQGTADRGYCLTSYQDRPMIVGYGIEGFATRTVMLTANGPECTRFNRRNASDFIDCWSDFIHLNCQARADPVALAVGDRLALVEVEYSQEEERFKTVFRLSSPADSSVWDVEKVIYTAENEVELYNVDLELVDGRLALLFNISNSLYYDTLYYMVADDASGTNWGEPVLLDDEYHLDIHPGDCLVDVDGLPAVCYVRCSYSPYYSSIVYRRANDIVGNDWTEVVLVEPVARQISAPLLLVSDGTPLVIYRDMNEELSLDCVHRVRAMDTLGDTWGEAVALENLTGSFRMDAGMMNGRPVLAWCGRYEVSEDYHRPCLFYAEAADSAALNWTVEDVAFITTFEGSKSAKLDIVSGVPIIAVSNFDGICGGKGRINVYAPNIE